MPGFNQTGPMGQGPMTGRGRGVCTTNQTGFGSRVAGSLGFGRGIGFGRGFRRGQGVGGPGYMGRSWRTGSVSSSQVNLTGLQNEMEWLHEQAKSMQNSLDEIHQRIAEWEKME